jgi:hypothetical protein
MPETLLDPIELDILRNALREHVSALTVDIGHRTSSTPDSLVRAANYIHSVFEKAGLTKASVYQVLNLGSG